MEKYQEWGNEKAKEIKDLPKDKRAEKLAEIKKDPDYNSYKIAKNLDSSLEMMMPKITANINKAFETFSEYVKNEEVVSEECGLSQNIIIKLGYSGNETPSSHFYAYVFVPEKLTDPEEIKNKIIGLMPEPFKTELAKTISAESLKMGEPNSTIFKNDIFEIRRTSSPANNSNSEDELSIYTFPIKLEYRIEKDKPHQEQVKKVLDQLSNSHVFNLLSKEQQNALIESISRTQVGVRKGEIPGVVALKEQLIDEIPKIIETSRGWNSDEVGPVVEKLTFENGDLLHGTTIDQLHFILKNGILCGEVFEGKLDAAWVFGGELIRAETSFYADFWEVSKKEGKDSMVVDDSWLHSDNNDRLTLVIDKELIDEENIARPTDYKYKEKAKLLCSFPESSMSHTCVFAGVPSNLIKGIIAGGAVDIERAKNIMVSLNKYIPIYNQEKQIIFTKEEFDVLRSK